MVQHENMILKEQMQALKKQVRIVKHTYLMANKNTLGSWYTPPAPFVIHLMYKFFRTIEIPRPLLYGDGNGLGIRTTYGTSTDLGPLVQIPRPVWITRPWDSPCTDTETIGTTDTETHVY